jgi:signal peptidase I
MPGQTVRYENDQLYIDEVPVQEPYIETAKEDVADSPLFFWAKNSGNFTTDFTLQDICGINGFTCDVIPEGWFLVLGDNRPHSKDSRHIGLVSEDQILGRAAWVQWPFDRFGSVE